MALPTWRQKRSVSEIEQTEKINFDLGHPVEYNPHRNNVYSLLPFPIHSKFQSCLKESYKRQMYYIQKKVKH